MRETYGVMSLPLLARPSSIIPFGSRDDTTDYEFADGVRLQVYELEEGKRRAARSPTDRAIHGRFSRPSGRKIRSRSAARAIAEGWSALLVGVRQARTVTGGKMESTGQGLLLRPEGREVIVTL